ncbi:MAG: N-formylglutamate amidohydrolase, partial [Cyclobacteriaceae bacterium]
LIQNPYLSYRQEVESKIEQLTKPVLHLSIHSFTPTFNEVERKVDIGLLFDPERQRELVFCNRLKESLSELLTGTTILFNEPYRGIDDGFTTHLRGKYDDSSYLGIEIEISQKYTPDLKAIKKALSIAIDRTMTSDIF